jgi:hypothetical protein
MPENVGVLDTRVIRFLVGSKIGMKTLLLNGDAE